MIKVVKVIKGPLFYSSTSKSCNLFAIKLILKKSLVSRLFTAFCLKKKPPFGNVARVYKVTKAVP